MFGPPLLTLLLPLLSLQAEKLESSPKVTFFGHPPLENSRVASAVQTQRWIYSFRGDWKTTKNATRKAFEGYSVGIPSYMLPFLGKRRRDWFNENAFIMQGNMLIMSITIVDDSITLYRNAHLTDAKDWTKLGPALKPDPGWITVVLARPMQGALYSRRK